ncbi:MAG: U32 family peptidase [Aristaeellaceae bacterium]
MKPANHPFELLAPAGDSERLHTALRFGADAVYLGGPMLQLRAGSVGFDMQSLAEAVRTVHAAGKRIYVTVNAFAGNADVDAAADYGRALHALGVDAAIVSDLGLIRTLRLAAPELEIHVSTQANCLNYAAACAYYDMGATRVVLGREMSLAEIRELRKRTPAELELEAFVHGAMCMSYSGRCMISAYLTSRSANKGACAQSCRWKYHLMEEKRPGEYFPVEEDENGMTILSSFDMNCLDFLDQIMDAGVTSFKLEGRMKSPYYVATVTNAYRKRIDGILDGSADAAQVALLQRELNAASHRPYASGFYFGEMKRHGSDDGSYLQDCNFVGVVRGVEEGRIAVEVRNRIFEGDRIEILSPDSLNASFVARDILDNAGAAVTAAARPSEIYTMACDAPVSEGDLLRVRIAKEGEK